MNHNDFNQEEDEKFFTEFKEKMAIDPLSDTVRHLEKQASKRQMFTILILVIMATGAGICWNMYSSYIATKEPATEVIALTPDATPDKVRPENPGGLLVPNQDKTVYNRLSSSKDTVTEEVVITQTAVPEGYFAADSSVSSQSGDTESSASKDVTVIYEPVKRTEDTIPNTKPIIAEQITYKSLFTETTPEKATPQAEQPSNFAKLEQQLAEKENAQALDNLVQKTIKDAEVKTTAAESEKVNVVSKPKELIKPALKAEKEKDKAKAKKTGGNWRIQLLSLGDEKSVAAARDKIKKKHSAILADYDYEIISANVGGKEIYRLRVKSFETSAAASEVCNRLKAAKQDCIVVKQ